MYLLNKDKNLISTDTVSAVYEDIKKIMKKNRITKNFKGTENVPGGIHIFTTPSVHEEQDSHINYCGKQWFWDSCFHAMILSRFDCAGAMEELFSLCAFQREDGFIPHMIYRDGDGTIPPLWAKEAGVKHFWRNPFYSDIIQPPVIAMAVEKIYNTTGDTDFLRTIIKKLVKYYDYLHVKRDPDRDNLISIIHPWESGWDNSQRWDEPLGLKRIKHTRFDIDKKKMELFLSHSGKEWNEETIFSEGTFNVEPVDFNVLYCVNMKSMERMVKVIGDHDRAELFNIRAENTRKAILEHMWDGDKYADLFDKEHRKSSVKAASMFYPMMLEGDTRYEYLIEKHLLNDKEFATPYGIPVTSTDDPAYDPEQYWRGNVWINVNYFVVLGLRKIYGDHKIKSTGEAWNYIRNSSYLLLKNFYEYYNPHTGEGYGAKSLAWNGLVHDMNDFLTMS